MSDSNVGKGGARRVRPATDKGVVSPKEALGLKYPPRIQRPVTSTGVVLTSGDLQAPRESC
jgi:hypothetical protein